MCNEFIDMNNMAKAKELRTSSKPGGAAATAGAEEATEITAGGWAGFILAIIVVLALRFVALGEVPFGTYIDESSIGYNAFSILRTGADEHGLTMPLFFKAFGEYKNPVFIYSLVPLVQIFDLSTWTVRLAAALFGLGTALLTALLAKQAGLGRWAMGGGFVLAGLTPWLFCLSRVGFEVVALPFFITLAFWSWLKAIRAKSLPWFVLSGSAWGVGVFSYPTARLMVPLLVLVLVASYYRDLRQNWATLLIGLTPLALSFVLLLVWAVQQPGTLSARFNELSIFNDQGDILTSLFKFAGNYLHYFSPSFLFTAGDANLRHHSGHGGELFVSSFPFLLAGVAVAWRRRGQALERFTLIGFLLFPLAASLTRDSAHALRTVNALPFIFLLVLWGGQWLWELFTKQRLVLGLWALLAIVEAASFYTDYFIDYPTRSRAWFGGGIEQTVKAGLQDRPGALFYSTAAFRDENLHDQPPFIQPYIQFLHFGKLDPKVFQQQGLAGFKIFPYESGMTLAKDSLLMLKIGQELTMPSGRPLVLPTGEAPPVGSALISQFAIPGPLGSQSPVYRIYRTP